MRLLFAFFILAFACSIAFSDVITTSVYEKCRPGEEKMVCRAWPSYGATPGPLDFLSQFDPTFCGSLEKSPDYYRPKLVAGNFGNISQYENNSDYYVFTTHRDAIICKRQSGAGLLGNLLAVLAVAALGIGLLYRIRKKHA